MSALKARAPALTPLPGSPLSSSPTKAKSRVGSTSIPGAIEGADRLERHA